MKFKLKRYIYFCQDIEKMLNFYRDVFLLKAKSNGIHEMSEWVELGGAEGPRGTWRA